MNDTTPSIPAGEVWEVQRDGVWVGVQVADPPFQPGETKRVTRLGPDSTSYRQPPDKMPWISPTLGGRGVLRRTLPR